MIENVSTQLTVFHCFAHCLLPGRAFASLYALLFLEKEAEIGGRVLVDAMIPKSRMLAYIVCIRVYVFRITLYLFMYVHVTLISKN